MASNNDRIEIKIVTSGDPKGAQAVGKSLDEVAKAGDDAAASAEANAEAMAELDKVHRDVAERVDASREKIEDWKTANDAARTSAEQGEQTLAQKYFPTFSKGIAQLDLARKSIGQLGQRLGGMPGMILQGIANPWAIAGAVAVGSLAKIGKALSDADRRQREWMDWAGKSWAELGLAIERVREQTDNTAAATGRFAAQTAAVSAAITNEVAALREREGVIAQRLADDEALAASAQRLAVARIDGAVAEGRMSKEEADRAKTMLELVSAEEEFARRAEASAQALQARVAALAEVKKEVEALAMIEARARKEAEEFEKKPTRDQAAEVDPALQRDVDSGRRDVADAARDSRDPGAIERVQSGAARADEDVSPAERLIPTYGAIKILMSLYKDWTETTERVQTATELLSEATKATADAEQKRDAAIAEAEEAKRSAAEAAAAQAEEARAEAERLQAEVEQARNMTERFGPGGVERQIFDNEQAARNGGQTPPVAQAEEIDNEQAARNGGQTPPVAQAEEIDAGFLGQVPRTAATEALKAALADGVQAREVALIEELIGVVTFQSRNNGALKSELDRLAAQVADLRQRGN